ncbi:MAG: hypothetical protein IT583_07080, partial [Verrucomicrobia bacterium]|nr:hypothetical protein [Verrucomicrobiota bacterium]
MSIRKLLVMLAGALFAISSQAALIDVNFDAVTPGVYSNLNVYTSTTFGAKTGTGVTVASITTNGFLANGSDHALKLGGTGAPAWSMTFGAAPTGLTNGVFSMAFAASTAVNINLGGSGNTTAQLQLVAASDNKFGYRVISGGTTNWVYFDQTWTKSADQSLQVTFNTSN